MKLSTYIERVRKVDTELLGWSSFYIIAYTVHMLDRVRISVDKPKAKMAKIFNTSLVNTRDFRNQPLLIIKLKTDGGLGWE